MKQNPNDPQWRARIVVLREFPEDATPEDVTRLVDDLYQARLLLDLAARHLVDLDNPDKLSAAQQARTPAHAPAPSDEGVKSEGVPSDLPAAASRSPSRVCPNCGQLWEDHNPGPFGGLECPFMPKRK